LTAAVAALTGATGFVGGHFVPALRAAGYTVRALTRRSRQDSAGVSWIAGDLASPDSLDQLVSGADVVFHLAGAIKGLTEQDFVRANVTGTANLLAAMQRQGTKRLVHVSTLAARQPQLSTYARTKAAGEGLARASGLAWSIVRPPGIYGPGDRETLAFFQMAARGIAPLPLPSQRLALLHVSDLTAALIAASAPAMIGATAEVSDEADLTLTMLIGALGESLGRSVRRFAVPKPVLQLAALAIQQAARWRGAPHILSADKVRELYHPDWSVSDRTLQSRTGWRPAIALKDGLTTTASWYRQQGWLKR
jgi:nucleoside-diphosphate-sugar epimerase